MSEKYENQYEKHPCYWGREPGSYVRKMVDAAADISGWKILDAGCGEGKNAVFLASRGADVTAVDSSSAALKNAKAAWKSTRGILCRQTDLASCGFER